MPGLIWIQTSADSRRVVVSDGIPEIIFRKMYINFFEKKKQQTTKRHAKLPSMQRVNSCQQKTYGRVHNDFGIYCVCLQFLFN